MTLAKLRIFELPFDSCFRKVSKLAISFDIALGRLALPVEKAYRAMKFAVEPTERVVEPASSIFDDHHHAAMRLNFIQEFRNRLVHRGEAGSHALLCAQYGSLYLAAMIRFFLWNIYKFRKLEVILDFPSLPLDAQKLEGNITLNRKRLTAIKRMTGRMAAERST